MAIRDDAGNFGEDPDLGGEVRRDLADLEAAIDADRRRLAATPPGSPDLAGHLCNLGIGLLSRYERSGALADLEAAIDTFQRAVDATRVDSPDLAVNLGNLGDGLRLRYER